VYGLGKSSEMAMSGLIKNFGPACIVSTSTRHCYANKIAPASKVLENVMSKRMIMVECPITLVSLRTCLSISLVEQTRLLSVVSTLLPSGPLFFFYIFVRVRV